jgi:hypothetical protein
VLGEPVSYADPAQGVDVPDELVINEFMANNDVAVEGPDGGFPDWIELYNGGTEAVDLGGMYLTDDLSNPDAWQFSSDTVIEAGGFLVVWADNLPDSGSLHAGFGLNASGEAVGLFAVDGETEVDSVVFGRQLDDVAYGRLPDGDSNWTYLTPTPGLSNSLGEVVDPEGALVSEIPDGLFINEFMADNEITIAGPEGTYPDWIELYYNGSEIIDLGGMYLTDDLNDTTAWQFPEGTIMEQGDYLVVWADNSSSGGGLHTGFALSANGEAIGLFASDGITLIDSVIFTKQLGDISYGRMPDGAENWEYLLSATPGWGNNKRPPTAESSLLMILLLIGLVGVVAVLFVAITKYSERHR